MLPIFKNWIMITVKILKQVGETGLRKVGTLLPLSDKQAKLWIKMGWAKDNKPKPKRKKKTNVTTNKKVDNGNATDKS